MKELVDKTEHFLYYEKHIKEINKAKPNNLQKFLKAIVYIQMNNILAAKKELTDILRTDQVELYFSEKNISHHDLSNNDKHFFNSILAYLAFLEDKFKEGPLADMIVTHIADYYQGEEQKKLLELRQNNFDQKFIKQNFSSPVWGKEYIGFWSKQSLKIMSSLEFQQLFEKNISESRLEEQFNSLVWIFKDYFPPRDEWRSIILKKAVSYYKSSEIKENYRGLILLKNESIKNQLAKQEIILSSPIYQLERKIYKELLGKKMACDFALSSLTKLGDEDELYQNQFKVCP